MIFKVKYAIIPILPAAIMFIFLISNISIISSNINKIDVYKKTDYDFIVSGFMNISENNDLIVNENVDVSVKFYNFNINTNNKFKSNILLSPDQEYFEHTFYNNKTLIRGAYETGKVLVDTKFEKKFNVSINDIVSFTLNGHLVQLPISGIFLSTDDSSFENGIVIGEWTTTFDNYFPTAIKYDLIFVQTSNKTLMIDYFESKDLSYVDRLVKLDETLSYSLPQIDDANQNIIITSVIALIIQLLFILIFLRKDAKRIITNIKENIKRENHILERIILGSFVISNISLFSSVLLFSNIIFNKYYFIAYTALIVYTILSTFIAIYFNKFTIRKLKTKILAEKVKTYASK